MPVEETSRVLNRSFMPIARVTGRLRCAHSLSYVGSLTWKSCWQIMLTSYRARLGREGGCDTRSVLNGEAVREPARSCLARLPHATCWCTPRCARVRPLPQVRTVQSGRQRHLINDPARSIRIPRPSALQRAERSPRRPKRRLQFQAHVTYINTLELTSAQASEPRRYTVCLTQEARGSGHGTQSWIEELLHTVSVAALYRHIDLAKHGSDNELGGSAKRRRS